MTFTPAHKPGGTPDGGQFTSPAHSDTVPALAVPAASPFKDADGTVWEFGGDEYQDTYLSHVNGIEARITTDIREEGARAKIVDYRGKRSLILNDQMHFDTLDEAKAHAKTVRERATRYEHNAIGEGSRSPWGKLQGADPIAAGVDAVWTAGHGGLKLSPERAAEVDPAWAEPAGWYEQDCSWAKAVITHHQDMPPKDVESAHKTARRWYPDQYTTIVGKDPAKYGLASFEPITAAESSIVETREFLAARADTHVRVERVDLAPDGHPGMIAVSVHDIAPDGRDEEGGPVLNARTILVPEAEWAMPHTERRTIPKSDSYRTLATA